MVHRWAATVRTAGCTTPGGVHGEERKNFLVDALKRCGKMRFSYPTALALDSEGRILVALVPEVPLVAERVYILLHVLTFTHAEILMSGFYHLQVVEPF
jgi:hypothetical protein